MTGEWKEVSDGNSQGEPDPVTRILEKNLHNYFALLVQKQETY